MRCQCPHRPSTEHPAGADTETYERRKGSGVTRSGHGRRVRLRLVACGGVRRSNLAGQSAAAGGVIGLGCGGHAISAPTMPSTVADIFAAAGVEPTGVTRWGEAARPPEPPAAAATGIYVVALTDQLDSLEGRRADAPISSAAVDELRVVRCKELTLDGVLEPARQPLTARLAAFWFPDEVVLYIGLAGSRKTRPVAGELAKRVTEYYVTPLGANGPHAGGWPLKTLSCLEDLYVHYAYCGDVKRSEDACIARFAQQVSPDTRARLHDAVRVMPFANLEFPKGNAKDHGIRGARAPKLKNKSARPRPTSAAKPPVRAATPIIGSTTPHHRTQNVTSNDINVGQVRVPVGATKRVLPLTRQDIHVVLRGRELTCRWDPRFGAKDRSGVIRVGKAAAKDLLVVGDVLAVSVRAGLVYLD